MKSHYNSYTAAEGVTARKTVAYGLRVFRHNLTARRTENEEITV